MCALWSVAVSGLGCRPCVRTLVGVTGSVLLGAAVGALATAAVLWVVWGRRIHAGAGDRPLDGVGMAAPELPPGATDVLDVLASTTIVVDKDDIVVTASPSAEAYGLVRRNRIGHEDIRALVRQVRADGQIREDTLRIGRGVYDGPGDAPLVMAARVAPLGPGHVLVLVQDRTHEQRLEEVRRDFVANISHELKTPVGGLSLLSEAVLDAKDDPKAVERFASRMQVEARRLSRLVTDIVDLTRLQVADSLHEPLRVDLGAVVREAVDSTAVLAEGKQILVQTVIEPDLVTFGDEDLLVTAVRNLVTNAISHSDPGTRVAVRAQRRDDNVEIVVADHGPGIAPEVQDRIFERFFRVDPARSRATGGTGLGLSIVKHVSAIHGGSISVWSQQGRGSTFSLRLPDSDRADRETAGGEPGQLPAAEAGPADTDELDEPSVQATDGTDRTPDTPHDARKGVVTP